MFLITVIYVLSSLYDRLSIYIIKLICILVYNKIRKKIKEINESVYLSISFCRITTLY